MASTILLYSQTELLSYKNQSIEEITPQFESNISKGIQLQKEGDFEQALELFEEAYQKIKGLDPKKESNAEKYLGILYWNIGQIEKSTIHFKNGSILSKKNELKILEQYFEYVLEIHRLYQEGKSKRKQNLYQDSSQQFQAAINIAREIQSKEHELKCLRLQSITYQEWGKLNDFLRLNEEALKLAEELRHKRAEAICTNNIGFYHLQFSNYSKALEFFNRSLNLVEEIGEKPKPEILNNIGIIYKHLGEFEKALDYLNRALDIDKGFGEPYYIALDLNDIGTTLRHMGLISGDLKILKSALEYYQQCLELAKSIERGKNRLQIEVTVYNNMGTIFSDLNDYEKALNYFNQGYEKAVSIQEARDMGMLLNNMGIVHSNMGNYEDSTEYFLRSIDLGNRLESGIILWEAYLELARNFVKQNRKVEALDKYEESINQIEKIRSQINLEEFKASYMGTDKRLEAYQEIISLLVSLHVDNPGQLYGEEAFNYLERGKARSFLDSLEISQINISQNVDFILQNREAEIMKEISTLYTELYASSISNDKSEGIHTQLREKENELETLKREIRIKSPAYANLRYPNIINLKNAQRLLDSKTAFFEYSLGEKISYAFVITEDNFIISPLPPRKEIKSLVSTYTKEITDKKSNDFETGRTLYKILVSPGLHDGISNIIIIPDDVLNYLPFEALQITDDENKWLIQNINIAYSPSISSLNEIIDRKKENGAKQNFDLLAFGDPYFGPGENEDNGNSHNNINNGYHYTRLKFSGTEIDKISKLFQEERVNIFLRKNAAEEQLKNHKLNDYRIIHFATHSEVDDENPIRSHIVLSLDDDPDEDGILQAREIYNLELNSDLVTLSACSTGLGKLIRGEGMEGLNRAFFYAGTSAVLMSLWTVNDQATFQLMERFYTHLDKSNSIMKSLRDAKLELINSDVLSHPYYWAGFIVSGKADHIIFPKKTTLVLILGLILVILTIFVLIILRKIKLSNTAVNK